MNCLYCTNNICILIMMTFDWNRWGIFLLYFGDVIKNYLNWILRNNYNQTQLNWSLNLSGLISMISKEQYYKDPKNSEVGGGSAIWSYRGQKRVAKLKVLETKGPGGSNCPLSSMSRSHESRVVSEYLHMKWEAINKRGINQRQSTEPIIYS